MLPLASRDSITSDEETLSVTSSTKSEKFHTPRSEEEPAVSLFLELEDRNSLISGLKNQLQNQKKQLMYYINKEISRSQIVKLSESASEESLPVNMALYRFCKQSGFKTKLQLLHERMDRLDYDVSHALKDHEFVIRKIINKLCEFVRGMSKGDFKDQFGHFINDPLHVNLFDKLLTATLNLRSKLEVFRNCCNRVLNIEEERNAIVDQVYSLPTEDRINCNYLVGIQMEKAQLENEIRRISRHNDAEAPDRHRIKELNVIEKILHNLRWELSNSFLENEDNCVNKMLKKMNSEAKVLLEMTKRQKMRFECESSEAKCPELNRVLLFINLASGEDKDLDRYGINSDEEIRFFQMIKKEIETMKEILKEELKRDLRKAKKECHILNSKLAEVQLDNSRNKLVNKSLQAELNELKTEQTNVIEILTQERDAYKTQVEDLHATREAYAQLVNRQPNIIEIEREYFREVGERDSRIMELEKIVSSQNEEIERLKSKLAEESDHVMVLNRFINLNRPNRVDSPETTELESARNNKVTIKSLSDGCCRPKSKKEKKLIKSEPIFPYCQRPKKTSYCELAKKSTSNKRTLETSSEKEFSTINRQSGEIVPRVSSEKNLMEYSSMLSVEIKYKNDDISDEMCEMDEFELYEDASTEMLMLD